MATDPPAQRVYRAACPNCGAPVDFRSAASAYAVCSFCRSTVVREGDALRKIGESAELFDDHSPLQLGVGGVFQGAPFTLVGRLQFGSADGTWNEWHALFDTGPDGARDGTPDRIAWLSEDNGRYVLAFDAPMPQAPPPPQAWGAGADVTFGGQRWSVASVTDARLIAAQGELPAAPIGGTPVAVVDLRNAQGEVATLDYGLGPAPTWSIGRSVALIDLKLHGLAESAEKTLRGRTIACPNCGAAIDVKLSTTLSVVCAQCRSVVDLTAAAQGNVGADLQHYAQVNGSEPQLPLGSIGQLALGSAAPLPWQVVGYVERCTLPDVADEVASDAGDDDDGEQTFWREYLLYHRATGFAFLVDAEDGWSWTVPLTGAPERFGESVKYAGVLYRPLYTYTGKVTYVLGEFYWQLARDQTTRNTDFMGTGAAAQLRLNREQTVGRDSSEVVWSGGATLPALAVQQAFRLDPAHGAALQRDAAPTFSGLDWRMIVLIVIVILILLLLLSRCSGGGVGYVGRAVGGAYGGYSSGGSHK